MSESGSIAVVPVVPSVAQTIAGVRPAAMSLRIAASSLAGSMRNWSSVSIVRTREVSVTLSARPVINAALMNELCVCEEA